MGLLDRPSTGITVGRGLDRLAEFQGNLLMGKIQAQNEEARQKDYFEKLAKHEEERSLNELFAIQSRLSGERKNDEIRETKSTQAAKAQDKYRERELSIAEKRANLDALSKMYASTVERYENSTNEAERISLLGDISRYAGQIDAITSGGRGLMGLPSASGPTNLRKVSGTTYGNPLIGTALGKR